MSSKIENSTTEAIYTISCKYCRCLLLLEAKLAHFEKPSPENYGKCSHYFYDEPPAWFMPTEADVSGKIYCPQCQSKLGHYSWMGFPCSCGKWIVPAFAFLKSKTDYLMQKKTC